MILGLVGMVVGVAVQGATTDDVSATVTAQLVSVSVSDGIVEYGILALNTTEDTVTLVDTQTATNDGNVAADLSIRSSDAVGGTTWELAVSAGSDAFIHEFSIDAGVSWAAFNVDNVTYSTLVNNVAASGNQTFDLKIGTPTASTDNVEKTITVTVQATI
ncbi:hypothetical protein LCGC14_0101550 [marine sediment metagenome]|uniref:Uncharacterized protein n=1 Tax=marine sediment metagenome TaxID=412755 RepID=A0A0F9VC02_9ZZZZ